MSSEALEILFEKFEADWQAGLAPRIESLLTDAAVGDRAELLRELIQIELWWRREKASPQNEAQYAARFPDDLTTVSEGFGLFSQRSQAFGAATTETVPYRTKNQETATQETVIETGSGAADSVDRIDQSSKQFGRYQLLKELGRGGMGAVFLAHDETLNRKVALKIPTFRESVRDEMLARFYREARAAAALRDPGICPVYDVGEFNGQAFIAMAFIAGHPLSDYTKSGTPQQAEKTVRVIHKLAQSMSEAHEAGIVHRDLKPANIMMEKGRRPVIMDFGLAYSTTEMESRLTGTGAILGTPTYMSPEQAMGDTDNIGPAADIYSLGVICYEMLAGCVPFEGNVTAVLTKIATQEPKPLSEYDLAIDSTLVAIVSRMMAKQASDRYESMGAVVKALTDYLQDYSELDSERESDTAPHMELISLCVQIEQRLRELVNRNGLRDRGTAKRYLEDLGRADALRTSSMNDLRRFVGIANRAIHGAEIKPNSADWAVEHGPNLVKQLTAELNCM